MEAGELQALEALVAEAVNATMSARPQIDQATPFFARAVSRIVRLTVASGAGTSVDASTQCELPWISHTITFDQPATPSSVARRITGMRPADDDYFSSACGRIELVIEEALGAMAREPNDSRSVEARLAAQLLRGQGLRALDGGGRDAGTQCARPWLQATLSVGGSPSGEDVATVGELLSPAGRGYVSSDDETRDSPVGRQPTGFKIQLSSVARDPVDESLPEAQPHTPKEEVLKRLQADTESRSSGITHS